MTTPREPIFQLFSSYIAKLIVGQPWGQVFPPQSMTPADNAADGRTEALRILARYLSELTFYRAGDKTADLIALQVPLERIFIEMPDNEVDRTIFPAIALLSAGDINEEIVGLGSWIDETSANKYGRNTVLQVNGQFTEDIAIDVLCKTRQERRALRVGINNALNPTEFMAGIRFRMPDYYNQVVTITPTRITLDESMDAAVQGRRGMRIIVSMTYLDVQLVAASPMIPIVTTNVDVESDNVTRIVLDLDALPYDDVNADP